MLFLVPPGSAVGEVVRLDIVFAGNAPNGEFESAGELAADPVQ